MIRILLVDDHAIVREGFKRLCEAAPDLQVVAEAGSVDEALAAVRLHALDVALVDISLGQQSGLQLLPGLLAIAPTLKLIIVSMHEDPALVAGADFDGAAFDQVGRVGRVALAEEHLAGLEFDAKWRLHVLPVETKQGRFRGPVPLLAAALAGLRRPWPPAAHAG